MILGIDEVGRGPWAGPLVVGAVVLRNDTIEGLTDSKKLSKQRRERLAAEIVESDAAYSLGWVHAAELDQVGLSQSLVLATRRAVEQIKAPYHEIIIDGTVNFLQDTGKGRFVTTMKKADLLISAVSAASILAKVARDDYMAELAEQYPGYGFESHVGYGTAKHSAAIEAYGITPEHRLSFAPVAKLANVPQCAMKPVTSTLTNKHRGNQAEDAATMWLESNGYKIVERNWKTRFCEIDIVAKKHDSLFFIEVKHRKSSSQGGGIMAITPKKLRQMHFAASFYLVKHQNVSACLAVLTTIGNDSIEVEQLIVLEQG